MNNTELLKDDTLQGQSWLKPRVSINQMRGHSARSHLHNTIQRTMLKKRAKIVEDLQELREAADCLNREANPNHKCFAKARNIIQQKTPDIVVSLDRPQGMSNDEYRKYLEARSWINTARCRFEIKHIQDDVIDTGNRFMVDTGLVIAAGSLSVALHGLRVGTAGLKSLQAASKVLPTLRGVQVTKDTAVLGLQGVGKGSKTALVLASMMVGTNAFYALPQVKDHLQHCVDQFEGDLIENMPAKTAPSCEAGDGPGLRMASSRLRRCAMDIAMGTLELAPLALSARDLRHSYKAFSTAAQGKTLEKIHEVYPKLKKSESLLIFETLIIWALRQLGHWMKRLELP